MLIEMTDAVLYIRSRDRRLWTRVIFARKFFDVYCAGTIALFTVRQDRLLSA